MRVYVNGQWVDGDARISITDRGFMYGEGVYESLRTYTKRIFAPHQHYERFKRSAEIMRLPFHLSFEKFQNILYEGINGLEQDCTIKIMLTAGEGGNPNLFVYIMELQAPDEDLYTYGVNVGISRFRKIPRTSLPPILKTNSQAHLRLARQGKEEFYEVIFLSHEGFVAEGSMSNIFLVENGIVVTPSLETGILDGITRSVVIELAKSLGISVEERTIDVDELFNCSEIFLTRTSAEIIPVRRIENRVLFENEPGGLTSLLMENFRPHIFSEQSLW